VGADCLPIAEAFLALFSAGLVAEGAGLLFPERLAMMVKTEDEIFYSETTP
jgi:hypothetical protein